MRRRTGVLADPYLRAYVNTIRHVLTPLVTRRTIDISAGTAWIEQFGFTDYTPVDIVEPHAYWDINSVLPDHLAGRYELAVCMGSLHYSSDPPRSLEQILRTLMPGGDLVMMVPWLYPPHDREIDRWRISPRQVHSMVAEHFDAVDIYNVGSLWHVPFHVGKRWLSGPFVGLPQRQLTRMRQPRPIVPVRAATAEGLEVSFMSPMNVVVHAHNAHARPL